MEMTKPHNQYVHQHVMAILNDIKDIEFEVKQLNHSIDQMRGHVGVPVMGNIDITHLESFKQLMLKIDQSTKIPVRSKRAES